MRAFQWDINVDEKLISIVHDFEVQRLQRCKFSIDDKSYNNFRKAMLGCRSASLLSRSMYNSSFERYLDTDERSMGAI